jgi:hypothetical protein
MTIDHQQQPHRSDGNDPRSAPPLSPVLAPHSDQTRPLTPSAPLEEEPTLLGFPAEFATGTEAERLIDTSAVEFSDRAGDALGQPGAVARSDREHRWSGGDTGSGLELTTLRRTDGAAGATLVLAGVAAAVSLALPWFRGVDGTALPSVRQGLVLLRSSIGALASSGLWPPLVVVLGGAVLLLLGLLMFRRARTHRLLGVFALLVAMAAGTGVVVPLANANWSTASFGPGMWCAAAVAALGTLGAMKAMLSAPLVRLLPSTRRTPAVH